MPSGRRSIRSTHLAFGMRCRPSDSGASAIGGGFRNWSTASTRWLSSSTPWSPRCISIRSEGFGIRSRSGSSTTRDAKGIDYQTGVPGELIFCLHEYNYHLLEKDKPVDGYLSPFFKYLDVSTESEVKERVEIAVQGVISFGRRDYPMLIELCEQLSRQTPRPNVVFNILGDADIRDGPKLRQRVTDLGLGNYFRLHSWLPALEFFRQLQRADYIMPLVSPRQRIYADNVNGHCRVRVFRCLWHASHPASGGRLAVGIPKSACVTYPGTEELGDTLLRGLDDRSRHARRYRAVVAEKIRQNLAILEDLTHNHPAFHAHRR